MAEQKECPTCGTPLAPHASSAYCPRCLLTAGLEDALDTGETDSTSLEGEDLLFCTVAVLLRRLDLGRIAEMSPDGIGSRSNGISESLVERGLLARGEVDTLRIVVSGILGLHNGDAESALDTLDPDGAIQTALFDPASAASFGTSGGPSMPILSGQTNAVGISGVRETPGRYSQLGEHGRGGMGRVLLVHDAILGRDVALKELAPGMELDADSPSTPVRRSMGFLSRFLQEARITGQLEHPSIVPVYELGYRPDRTLYYTMKLVRGKTLRKAIEACETLQDRLGLLPHFIDLCQAIAYAHSRGVIHRDIKPENVMVGEFGETVVLDWGLAKNKNTEDVHAGGMAEAIRALRAEGEREDTRTVYGDIIGTPAYMPPEQAEGRLDDIDERSDVYALGAVLYTILNNRPPYDGDKSEIARDVAAGKPPERPLPGSPPELLAIWTKAMAPRAEDRYPSAQTLAAEVQQFLTGGVISAYEYRFSEHLYRFVRRHKAILTVSLAALTLLVSLAVYSYVHIRRERDSVKQHLYDASVAYAYEAMEGRRYDDAEQSLRASPAEYRGWEWGMIAAMSHPNYLTLSDDLNKVRCAAISPNGQYAAAGGSLGAVRVWSLDDGRVVHRLTVGSKKTTSICFNNDNSMLMASDTSRIAIWNLATGEEILTTEFPSADVMHTAFSADSTLIAVTGGASWQKPGVCRVFEVPSGALQANLEVGVNTILNGSAFSPDGNRLVTASFYGDLNIWDTQDWSESRKFVTEDPQMVEVSFNADGTRIITNARTDVVHVWDAETGDRVHEFDGQLSGVFAPDGSRIFTHGESSGDFNVWDSGTGQLIDTFDGIPGASSFSVGAQSARALIQMPRGRLRLMELSHRGDVLDLIGHKDAITTAAFSPDSTRIITGSGTWREWEDPRAIVWDVETGRPLTVLETGVEDAFNAVAFMPDGNRVITGTKDHIVGIWEASTGVNLQSCRTGHYVKVVAASPDGRQVVSTGWGDEGENISTQVWDPETGACLASLQPCPPNKISNCLVYDPLGRFFAVGTRAPDVIVWDAVSFEEIVRLQVNTGGWVSSLAVSPDGRFLAVDENVVTIWDTRGWRQVTTLEEADKTICFSPDGTRLVSGGQIWDTRTWRKILTLARAKDFDARVTFSPNGKVLFTGGGEEYILWNAFPWHIDESNLSGERSFSSMLDGQRQQRILAIERREAELDERAMCMERLRTIDRATIEWATASGAALGALPPPLADLGAQHGLGGEIEGCPSGGEVALQPLGGFPQCSLHGVMIGDRAGLEDALIQVAETISGLDAGIHTQRLFAAMGASPRAVWGLVWKWIAEEPTHLPAALALTRRATELHPDVKVSWRHQASVESRMGLLDDAVTHFRAGLEENHAPSAVGLAFALISRGTEQDLNEALTVLSACPETGATLYTDDALVALEKLPPETNPELRKQIRSLLERHH